MQRIQSINPAEATGKAKQLLDGVQAKLGMTPNLMKALANAPAALDAYLHFGAALGTGALDSISANRSPSLSPRRTPVSTASQRIPPSAGWSA